MYDWNIPLHTFTWGSRGCLINEVNNRNTNSFHSVDLTDDGHGEFNGCQHGFSYVSNRYTYIYVNLCRINSISSKSSSFPSVSALSRTCVMILFFHIFSSPLHRKWFSKLVFSEEIVFFPLHCRLISGGFIFSFLVPRTAFRRCDLMGCCCCCGCCFCLSYTLIFFHFVLRKNNNNEMK